LCPQKKKKPDVEEKKPKKAKKPKPEPQLQQHKKYKYVNITQTIIFENWTATDKVPTPLALPLEPIVLRKYKSREFNSFEHSATFSKNKKLEQITKIFDSQREFDPVSYVRTITYHTPNTRLHPKETPHCCITNSAVFLWSDINTNIFLSQQPNG